MDAGHTAWLSTDDLPGIHQNAGLLFFCPELVQHISWNTSWDAAMGINIRCQCEVKVQVRGRKWYKISHVSNILKVKLYNVWLNQYCLTKKSNFNMLFQIVWKSKFYDELTGIS